MDLLSIVITIFAVMLGLIFRDSKHIGQLLLLLLFCLITFEYTLEGDGDYSAYESVYETAGSGDVWLLIGYEPVFVFFFVLCNKIGLSFVATKGVIALIVLFFLYKSICNYTKNNSLVLSLFFIFPALFDAELLRWLLAESIVVYGFKFLLRGSGIKDYLYYCIFIIIASLFHSGSLAFFIFLLSAIKNRRVLGLIICVSTLVIIFARSVTPLYSLLSSLPFGDTMQGKHQTGYMGNSNALIACFFRYFMVLALAVIAVYFTGYTNKTFLNKSGNYYDKIICSKIMIINAIAILLVGLNMFSAQAQRMYHVIVFLNYIAFAVKCEEGKKFLFGLTLTVMMSLFFLVFTIYASEGTLPVFRSHFTVGYLTRMFQMIFG